MSLLRSVAKSIAGFFFTISLIATISIFSLVVFTEFGTVKEIITKVFEEAPAGTPSTDFEGSRNLIESLREGCNKSGAESVSVGADVVLKCSDLKSVSSENFQEFTTSTIAQTLYYKTYDCGFLECVRRGEQIMPLIITELAHKFYQEILNYAIIVTIVLGALFVLAMENLKARLKGLGFSFLWSSVPFLVMSYFMQDIAKSIAPAEIVSRIQPVLDTFFSPTFSIYIYLLVAGVALVVAGYVIGSQKFNPFKKS